MQVLVEYDAQAVILRHPGWLARYLFHQALEWAPQSIYAMWQS